jgi:hypothetical protein
MVDGPGRANWLSGFEAIDRIQGRVLPRLVDGTLRPSPSAY